MKKIFQLKLALVLVLISQACSLDPVADPNFPSVNEVEQNATKAQLDGLIIGQFSVARNGLATYTQVVGTLGKELFNFNTTESRWMADLNGTKPLDNSSFYNGATTSFGLPVRQANIILSALENTSSIAEEQKDAYRGVANTFKALAYLYMLNMQYNNGIRLDVEDPFNPSKPVSYSESLAGIAAFLDEGATQLTAAGEAFPFKVPPSYAGFNTPAGFRQFNRAVALRVAIYQNDWEKAENLLPQTFITETVAAGFLNIGPKHSFSASSPDLTNPMLSTATQIIVGVEKIWDDAEPNDARKSKVAIVTPVLGYTSGVTYFTKYKVNMYTAADNPVPVIRNEELLLIAAEVAAHRGRPADAVKYIDLVRTNNALPAYAGATDETSLINAILKERLYSLFYEGHRWIDMRRYGKLNEIELPVDNMKAHTQMERPAAEVNWDNANP
jgi:hypothetical protein